MHVFHADRALQVELDAGLTVEQAADLESGKLLERARKVLDKLWREYGRVEYEGITGNGVRAGWPLWDLLRLHEWRVQVGNSVEVHGDMSFCPAMEWAHADVDKQRVLHYLQSMKELGVNLEVTLSGEAAGERTVGEVAIVVLLGCDEYSDLRKMLIQVDALRTLRYSIEKQSTIRPPAWAVMMTDSTPDRIKEQLQGAGFSLWVLPPVASGFGGGSGRHLAELETRWRAGQYPTGWWWKWLKMRIDELVEAKWALYIDIDMLVVGSLDPLLGAGTSQWADEADLLMGLEPRNEHEKSYDSLNDGLYLIRADRSTVPRQLMAEWLQRIADEKDPFGKTLHNTADEHVLERVLVNSSIDLGEARFEGGRLVGCTRRVTRAEGEEGLRWCRLPRHYNIILPDTVDEDYNLLNPRSPRAKVDDRPESTKQWLATEPPVVIHYTGYAMVGKPWEKGPGSWTIWDKQWWQMHEAMCAEAEQRPGPPCAIRCDLKGLV